MFDSGCHGKSPVSSLLRIQGLSLGDGKVVYDDMPSYAAHGWKYIAVDKDGWFFLPFGPPFNIGIPPTSVSQIRRVDPKTGNAETWALGVRNSVGGDVDPRTGKYWFTQNARDWINSAAASACALRSKILPNLEWTLGAGPPRCRHGADQIWQMYKVRSAAGTRCIAARRTAKNQVRELRPA
jgi:hypothetical protein